MIGLFAGERPPKTSIRRNPRFQQTFFLLVKGEGGLQGLAGVRATKSRVIFQWKIRFPDILLVNASWAAPQLVDSRQSSPLPLVPHSVKEQVQDLSL